MYPKLPRLITARRHHTPLPSPDQQRQPLQRRVVQDLHIHKERVQIEMSNIALRLRHPSKDKPIILYTAFRLASINPAIMNQMNPGNRVSGISAVIAGESNARQLVSPITP